MNNNGIIQGKKSLKGIGKHKIDLFSSVVDFDTFFEMIRSNNFPLIIRLNDEQLNNKNSEFSILNKYYVRKEQLDDEFSNRYMVLNSVEIEKEFFEGKIYIDKYFDSIGEIYKVDVLYPGNLQEGFARIGLFRRKGLFFDKNSLIVHSIRDMYNNAYKKYMEDNKKLLLASIDKTNFISKNSNKIFTKKSK